LGEGRIIDVLPSQSFPAFSHKLILLALERLSWLEFLTCNISSRNIYRAGKTLAAD
jgi:hypothetical protein